MNIINTDIVNGDYDIFWNMPAEIQDMEPRPVLVLTADYAAGSAEEEQLTGILSSGCRLMSTNYNIIKFPADMKTAWHKLRDKLEPRVVLLFNIHPQQLGISALFRLNEINSFDNCYWAPTLSLTQMIQDKVLKGQIWNNALKPLFVDKVHGDLLIKKS